MIYCFLIYDKYRFDLIEGNNNGKKRSIEDFIHVEKIDPLISIKDEYLLLKKVLKQKILPVKEMKGISERILLKAREESIIQLENNVKS